jgi:hypothetical protein
MQTRDDLTAQERQVALLARDGMSNIEIDARLFLSHAHAKHLGECSPNWGLAQAELVTAPNSGSELVPAARCGESFPRRAVAGVLADVTGGFHEDPRRRATLSGRGPARGSA